MLEAIRKEAREMGPRITDDHVRVFMRRLADREVDLVAVGILNVRLCGNASTASDVQRHINEYITYSRMVIAALMVRSDPDLYVSFFGGSERKEAAGLKASAR